MVSSLTCLISSFAAREVFVGTMAIVYNVEGDVKEGTASLRDTMRAERPQNGPELAGGRRRGEVDADEVGAQRGAGWLDFHGAILLQVLAGE